MPFFWLIDNSNHARDLPDILPPGPALPSAYANDRIYRGSNAKSFVKIENIYCVSGGIK